MARIKKEKIVQNQESSDESQSKNKLLYQKNDFVAVKSNQNQENFEIVQLMEDIENLEIDDLDELEIDCIKFELNNLKLKEIDQDMIKYVDILYSIDVQKQKKDLKINKTTYERISKEIQRQFESSISDESSEEEIESSKKKLKKSKQTKSSNKSQDLESEEDIEVKDKSKFKKGVWNPDVQIEQVINDLENKSDKIIEVDSNRMNNRNLIRAAQIKNHKLLEKLLIKNDFLFSYFQSFGSDSTYFTPIDCFFRNNDKKGLDIYLKHIYNQNNQLTQQLIILPPILIQNINTGFNSIYAYGVQVRQVNVGRGGKEYNNAFTSDQVIQQNISDNQISHIITKYKNIDMIKLIAAYDTNLQNQIDNKFVQCVRAGNFELAGYLAKDLFKRNAFGVNQLHVDVLNCNNDKGLSKFNKANVTKQIVSGHKYYAKRKFNKSETCSPIHCAAINPNPEIIKALLQESPETLTFTDEILRKPVHYAAVNEQASVLQFLKTKNVILEETDKQHFTPLILAAMYGKEKTLAFLLQNVSEKHIKYKTKSNYGAVHLAAINGHLNCLKLLKQYNADLNQPCKNTQTALMLASENGHFEVVKYLHRNGSKILKKDKLKRTALIFACKNGWINIVSYLLKYGSDLNQPDSSNNYPIHYAAGYGWNDIVHLLIKSGADQNVLNAYNFSPLLIAMLKNEDEIVKTLLEYENTLVDCKDDNGRTLLSYCVTKINKNSMKQMRHLIENKQAQLNLQDLQDNSYLHHLLNTQFSKQFKPEISQIQRNQQIEEFNNIKVEIFKYLIQQGADINLENKQYQMVIDILLQQKNFELVKFILMHDNFNSKYVSRNGDNVYHKISSLVQTQDGQEILKQFISKQNNIVNKNLFNQYNKLGLTPFMMMFQHFGQSCRNFDSLQYNLELQNYKDKNFQEWQKQYCKNQKSEKELYKEMELDQFLSEDEKVNLSQDNVKLTQKAPRNRVSQAFRTQKQQQSIKKSNLYKTQEEEEELVEDKQLSKEEKEKQRFEKEFKLELNVKEIIITKVHQVLNEFVKNYIEFLKFCQSKSAEIELLIEKKINFAKEESSQVRQKMQIQNQILENQNLQKLDEKQLDINQYFIFGRGNMFHLIADFPIQQMVEYLIVQGLNLNLKDVKEQTPMFVYIQNCSIVLNVDNQVQMIENLIKQNADIDSPDYQQNYPIMEAFYKNQSVFDVLKLKTNLNVQRLNGNTLLHEQVLNKNFQKVEQLLIDGINPNIFNIKLRNALHLACNLNNGDNFEMEQLLLKYNIQLNSQDIRGRTPLHYLFIKIKNPFNYSNIDPIEAVTSILSYNCDINLQDIWKRTPLHYAIMTGACISAISLLKISTTFLEQKDEDGNTPLALALKMEKQNITTMLIQQQCDVNQLIFPMTQKLIDRQFINGKEVKNMEIEVCEQNELNESNDENNISELNENKEIPQNQIEQPITMFTKCIQLNWQGLAYLIIQSGYSLMKAIYDSLYQKKFQYVFTLLSKSSDNQILQQTNENGQNLYHAFVINGQQANQDDINKIIQQLKQKEIHYDIFDDQDMTAIHYAANNNFYFILKSLTTLNVNIDISQNGGTTPFIEFIKHNEYCEQTLDLFIKNNVDLNRKFKYCYQDQEFLGSILTYLIQVKKASLQYIHYLVCEGADINLKEQNSGYSPLIFAIRQNQTNLVRYLLQNKRLNKEQIDNQGRNPIHHVVTPLEYGSFQNVKLLEELAKHFDVNQVDQNNNKAYYYASKQGSTLMKEKLKQLGGVQDIKKQIVRDPTSVIANIQFMEIEFDYEQDAAQYLSKVQSQLNDKMGETKIQPDVYVNSRETCELIYDDNNKPYDLDMTKVDVASGGWCQYLFYKMQILLEKNRQVYILFTRWGRIYEQGQLQNTAYPTLDACIAEFKKIYHQKTANIWGEQFQQVKMKYRVIKKQVKSAIKEAIVEFDIKNAPKSNLNQTIYNILTEVCDLSIYKQWLIQNNISSEFYSLSTTNKLLLLEAQQYIDEIAVLVEHISTIMQSKTKAHDFLEQIFELKMKIAEKSSRFYEIIPLKGYEDRIVPLIEHTHEVQNKDKMVTNLINFEQIALLLLGALNQQYNLNPYDYICQNLSVKLQSLQPKDQEYKLIKQYVRQDFTENQLKVIAIERMNEAETIQMFKNRKLLIKEVQGTEILGVILNGFQTELNLEGSNAIQFNDRVDLQHYNQRFIHSIIKSRYFVFVEIGLGEQYNLYNDEQVNFPLPNKYQSLVYQGHHQPIKKESVILSNGTEVPIGKFQYFKEMKVGKKVKEPRQLYNSYYVFQPEQVRLRYLVQIQNV